MTSTGRTIRPAVNKSSEGVAPAAPSILYGGGYREEMAQIETIERLCAIVQAQSEIIREQALVIEEWLAVDDALRVSLAAEREAVDAEIADCGKEEDLHWTSLSC